MRVFVGRPIFESIRLISATSIGLITAYIFTYGGENNSTSAPSILLVPFILASFCLFGLLVNFVNDLIGNFCYVTIEEDFISFPNFLKLKMINIPLSGITKLKYEKHPLTGKEFLFLWTNNKKYNVGRNYLTKTDALKIIAKINENSNSSF